MSRRKGTLTTVRTALEIPADGGESPNRQVPWLTVEVRIHWPNTSTWDDIANALGDAYDKAYDEARAKYLGEPVRRYHE